MHKQDVTQWQTAVSLYRDVLSMPEADRQSHIDSLGIEPVVQEKLKQLLNAEQVTDADPLQNRLDHLIARLGSDSISDAEVDEINAALIGRNIGDWTIMQSLGRGGMASVYLAERSGVEFEQRGALKLLSLLMLATGGSKRFVREQQFLARLQHPNIAMLLDGGMAEDGTPYLVTELVEGLHIRDYCSDHNLNKRQIVRLLLQVCAAVKHAHGHLILHRDIKPSNVMVTDDGQVKLLDFGIGKLADQASQGTQTKVFTPKYAAPEQHSGDAVTTATDVYGLGMLGRTLLQDQLRQSDELNHVLHMATHEEATRRYSSVESLERDLLNWLEGRPIAAVADSRMYHLRKYVRRHWRGVSAAAVMLLMAIVGVSAVLWQANAARIEAEKAQTLSTFMVDLFAGGDLFSGQGPDTSIASLMESGAQRARVELEGAPEARAEVLRVIGLAQTEFGQYDEAGENLHAALDSASNPLDRARVLGAMGVWAAERAEFNQGIAWMKEALEVMTPRLPAYHPDRLEIETSLINFLLFTGENQQSLDRADQLVADIGDLNRLAENDHANVLRSRAMVLTQVNRFDEAISDLQKAIELAKNLQPPRPALVAAFLNDLAIAQTYSGDQQAAIDAFNESYRTQSDIYGTTHKRTITSGSNLVHTMRSAGQTQQALELGNQVLANSLSEYGSIDRSVVLSRFALALVLSDVGRDSEADEQMVASVAALRQLDDMRSDLPSHLSWRGEILIRQGRFVDAVVLLQESELIHENEFPNEARRYRVAAQRRLVQAHAALGECEQANGYMAGIADDLATGNVDQMLATQLYLLNCQTDTESANNTYRDIIVSSQNREKLDSSLRAALRWASGRFSSTG